jgi:hypothetical protein
MNGVNDQLSGESLLPFFEAFVGGSRYCTMFTQGCYQTTVLPFAYKTDVEATITQQLLQNRLLHIAALEYTY